METRERGTLTCASYSQIRDQKYSLSALTAHAEKEKFKKGQRPCTFCNLFDHSPRRCFKISDPKVKRNISKRRERDVSFALKTEIWRKNVLPITDVINVRGNTIFLFV